MPTPLIAQLVSRHGLPALDTDTVDAFLSSGSGEPAAAILFFTGDASRPEANDVAVVLPELLEAFAGRLRAAVVARAAEAALMPRFGVRVLPSLALVRDGRNPAVIPKIQDWSSYVSRIEGWLAPDQSEAVAMQGGRA